jgi:hypothetical protein
MWDGVMKLGICGKWDEKKTGIGSISDLLFGEGLIKKLT